VNKKVNKFGQLVSNNWTAAVAQPGICETGCIIAFHSI